MVGEGIEYVNGQRFGVSFDVRGGRVLSGIEENGAGQNKNEDDHY